MNQFSALIVDDDEVDRELLGWDLEHTGLDIKVLERNNGESALEFFRDYKTNRTLYPENYPPRITFLDINMPILDGFGFLEQFDKLRGELELNSCVVIMFTTSEAERDRKRAMDYEFVVDYLIKGQFEATELKEKLVALTQKKQD